MIKDRQGNRERIKDILFNDREVTKSGGRYGKAPTETLQDVDETLNKIMETAWDMFGRASYVVRFEECNSKNIWKNLEANISIYNLECGGEI